MSETQFAQPGDVIQINDGNWDGALLIAEQVKGWGVSLAYCKVGKEAETFYRVEDGKYYVIGQAQMVRPKDDEEEI